MEKQLLQQALHGCSIRGLDISAGWLAETLVGIPNVGPSTPVDALEHPSELATIAKTFFNTKAYERCAQVVKDKRTPLECFLWGFSLYLAGERRKHQALSEATDALDQDLIRNPNLDVVLNYLDQIQGMDGYLYYLKGELDV